MFFDIYSTKRSEPEAFAYVSRNLALGIRSELSGSLSFFYCGSQPGFELQLWYLHVKKERSFEIVPWNVLGLSVITALPPLWTRIQIEILCYRIISISLHRRDVKNKQVAHGTW